jgi:anti-sigma B factor antagonist
VPTGGVDTVDQAFGISELERDGVTVLSVTGEVDVATAPALRSRLDDTVDTVGGGTVVVDLTGVTFIDSTGLGVLIGARKRCSEAGRELRVVVSEPRILKVFEITGLTDLFAIHPSLDLAVAG